MIRSTPRTAPARAPALLALALLLPGCGALIDRATDSFTADLERAVVNYDEPSVVERGLPTFLLILEARVEADPRNAATRLSVAELTSTYAGLFVEEPDRRRRLTERALRHARAGACEAVPGLCGIDDGDFEDFERRLGELSDKAVDEAYVLGTVWASWIAASSDDFRALADLPRVEALLSWVAERDPVHDDGAVWLYLAVLNSQRPPAAGGRPDLAREQFERARQVSEGRNLLIPVLMADEYARLVFDRDLFVELLEGVRAADPDREGYVLANRIALERAERLLEQTSRIFD
ncbi:TRAP transporter TatT component family protein [Halomonas denitrificans]|nr:TRAP transporter TatT component family protein [Halomonas denitrificans]